MTGHIDEDAAEAAQPPPAAERDPDFNPWMLLLIPPIVVPLLTLLYNRADPKLGAIPFYYWFQGLWVIIGGICCGIVYLMTRRARGDHR